MIHYFVSQGKRNYNTQLYLLPSTSYVISVIAVNEKNSRSSQAEVNVSSKVEVAFASEDKLQVTQKGVTINIEVPRVVNGTQRTMVSVKVKGFVECLEEQWQTPVLSSNVMEWTVEKYQPEAGRSKHLTIDPNRIPGAASNCSLNLGKIYEINAYVEDPFFELSASHIPSVITFIANGESRKSNFTWLVTIVPVLATCSLLIVFIYLYRIRRRASKQPREPSYLEIIPLSSIETTANDSSTHFHPDQGLRPQPDANEIQSSSHLYSLPKETDSCCVSVEYFQEYVKRAAASGLLHSQFMLLPKGFTRASDYAKLPANMPENRNRNLVPLYDDTRVVLEEISGDPYSDYINASYIKGYKKERAYIAAQGPTADTMKDFWRMVWQEEVHVICMLTNVISCTETKCEQYWPDFGTGMQYGDFFVLNSEEQVSADYTFRILELSHRQDTRIVKHLHYTRWPRLGIPVYPQTLVAYLKKLEQTPSGKGPIVVHCRFGDDRTGTLILCHICIHQAVAEKEIDVTATITKMRNSRADMVGTLQQYVLAHIIITESLVSLPTQISCSEVLSGGIRKMKMQLPSDIQRLNDTAWQEEVLRSSAAPRSPIAVANETLPELVADTPGVTYSNLSESEMKQFNAVSADGIKVKKQYLTSQLPSSFILSSFWRFVVEKNIKLIIILQCSDPRDPTCCDIMPNESIIGPVPHIQLENNQCLDEGEYSTTDRLLLTNTSEKSAKTRSVTVLTCREWGRGEYEKPPSPAALVSLWIASEKIPREEGQTLVLCDDGVTGCGLYLALSFLLERMALEGECDVISAVRTVRRSKMEFMQSLEQCEFLYDAAVSYAERFQTYANFS